jgi:hypothetical protein
MANLGVTQQSFTALIAGGFFCFLPIQIIIHSNIFECPRNGLNDNTQHMLLHNWNTTTCHNYYSTTIMTNLPNPDDTLVKTTIDNKFIQAKHIYAIAKQLTDATEVLEDLCSAVCNWMYSRAKLLQDVAFVKKYVVPLMKDSVDTITTAARILSPIAGVKYVYQRNEKKRKREIVMIENTTLSLNKGMIIRHVNDGIHNNKKSTFQYHIPTHPSQTLGMLLKILFADQLQLLESLLPLISSPLTKRTKIFMPS